ncbi:MAG TPA: acyltransferase [Cyclobacteriaceae bacterium]|nr:acyltransferase [Cyclobacteriaceae bacterium]
MTQPVHFPGLNGLRAIAAMAVVFAHITDELPAFGLNAFVFGQNADGNPKATLLAGYGVSIFFALSGFLITYLLLEEKKVQTINIRNFYMRRILRIWPLYYTYLVAALLTAVAFKGPVAWSAVSLYVFLSANIPFILHTGLPFLVHYWSLGVEEQFYAFWPWLVRHTGNLLRAAVIISVSLILLKCAIRLADIQYGGLRIWYDIIHVTRFHCMLMGAIGAMLYDKRTAWFLRITTNWPVQLLAWIIIILAAVNKFHVASVLDNEIISAVTVALIMGQIHQSNRIVNLEIAPLDFLGKISYGLYVIHPLLIFWLSRLIRFDHPDNPLNYVLVFVLCYLLTIAAAWISYQWWERPFLKQKLKYTTVANADSLKSES